MNTVQSHIELTFGSCPLAAMVAFEAAVEASQNEQPTSCQATRRWTGPGRKPRVRRGNGKHTFLFAFCGEANPPSNLGDIPDSQECTNKTPEMNTYGKQQIIDTILRGAKYKLGNQNFSMYPPSNTLPIHLHPVAFAISLWDWPLFLLPLPVPTLLMFLSAITRRRPQIERHQC